MEKTTSDCKWCDKSFNQLGTLNNKLGVHSGNKSFHCKQCDKIFKLVRSEETIFTLHNSDPFPPKPGDLDVPDPNMSVCVACMPVHVHFMPI